MVSKNQQRRHYDAVGDEFDDRHNLGLGRDNRNHLKKQQLIAGALPPLPNREILEVGCGTGLHGREWEEVYEYVGVDISAEMLAVAEERLTSGQTERADACELPFADDRFGAVVGTAVLHHMPSVKRALAEWVRVTEPGGAVALVEPNALFPKDLLDAMLNPVERGALRMRPRYIERAVPEDTVRDIRIEHRLYTPPFPEVLESVFNRIDAGMRYVPVLRRLSIQLLIVIHV